MTGADRVSPPPPSLHCLRVSVEIGQGRHMTVHDIPAQAIHGRTGVHGQTFSGYIDLVNGAIHFDCAEDPSFHLHVYLNQTPATGT